MSDGLLDRIHSNIPDPADLVICCGALDIEQAASLPQNFQKFFPYRCPKHNRAVGGVPTSAHTRGYAVDIRCVDSHSRFVMLQALLEAGFRRVELAPTWIHVDNDPDKPRDVAFYQHGGKY